MKKILATFIIGTTMSFSNVQAQFAVTVLSDLTAMINQIETIGQWTEQISEMKAQYDQMEKQYEQLKDTYDTVKDTYDAVTGARNLGDILNNPEFANYLPSDWKSTYDNINNNGIEGLSAKAKEIYDRTKVGDRCNNVSNSNSKKICETESIKGAQDLAFVQEAYETAEKRLGQIESLMEKINTTQDPKEIAELTARIGAENAMLQNEAIKMALFKEASAANDKLIMEKQKQLNIKEVSKTGTIDITNFNW